jgi:hypothetical protein
VLSGGTLAASAGDLRELDNWDAFEGTGSQGSIFRSLSPEG